MKFIPFHSRKCISSRWTFCPGLNVLTEMWRWDILQPDHGPVSLKIFPSQLKLVRNLFCSPLNSHELIPTNFCACAKICRDVLISKGTTANIFDFNRFWILMEKRISEIGLRSLIGMMTTLNSFKIFLLVYIWLDRNKGCQRIANVTME